MSDASGVIEMKSVVELSDVWKVWVACADQSPPEQLECWFVSVEELSSVIVINIIDVDCTKRKADVNDNKDEEENQNIDNHVGHWDNDGSSLPPHQAGLKRMN